MAVVLIAVVLVLAVGGAIAFAVKSRSEESAAAEAAGTGPNEFLQEPPTSFPITAPTPVVVIDVPDDPATTKAADEADETAGEVDASAPAVDVAEPVDEPSEPSEPSGPVDEVAPVEQVDEQVDEQIDEQIAGEIELVEESADEINRAAGDAVTHPAHHADEDDGDDEVVVSRFRAPGTRSTANPDLLKPMASARPVFHLEAGAGAEPEQSREPEQPGVPEQPGEPEQPDGPDEVVIDLADAPAAAEVADGADADWADAALEAEPDAVDHVLQALITRARFKQVDVEEVATELVERADLRGQEVSEVLADLVGRADDAAGEADRTSELTLFNDAVPSRPGQLTDFALLAPAEKKRIIIRVLCLLVARSEDQQLPPREESTDAAAPKSWPLARAVWPLATAGDDDGQLPSRRLATSG